MDWLMATSIQQWCLCRWIQSVLGIRSKGWRRYYWLDLSKLVGKLLRPGQQLVVVRYFTARVLPAAGDQEKSKRQGVTWRL